jgi:ATP-dependent Lon protease
MTEKKTKAKKKKAKTSKAAAAAEESQSSRQVVPLLPLRDIVIFPQMVVPFFVGREKSINALEASMANKTEIFLCTQKDSQINEPEIQDLFDIGTLASILQLVKLPDGTLKVLVEGRARAKRSSKSATDDYFMVEAEELDETPRDEAEAHALMRTLFKAFENFVRLNKRIPAEVLVTVQGLTDPSKMADSVIPHLNLKLQDKQELLELAEPIARIEKLVNLVQNEIEILQIERRIRSRVRKQMEKSQKEYYLNEQMAAIQKELGERDEFKTEIQELENRIKEAKMSEEAHEKADSELRKLKMMAPISAEATVIRNYLEWLIELPWGNITEDNLDLKHAKKILDRDHYGLEKIKDRIIEYLAVQNLTKSLKGPILCFVGPPGVGKSSLATSIADAVERKFVRISLGGLRDEAEIRGHRRTYIGAMPGKIIQGIRKAGSKNPVLLLDELDKMGNDFRGDPASAMLEVLDPGQNSTFNDHYMEVDFDISGVLFIATANSLSGIPQPLMDRMEIIHVPSYLETEKIEISKRHLVVKQLKDHGLTAEKVNLEESALVELIRYYCREAGVRNVSREIANLCRKAARKIVDNPKSVPVKITEKEIEEYLGPRRYKYGTMEQDDQIGMTNGLAWTEVGGDLLNIEVSVLPGKGGLRITGKLGDVMQESAHAAYSYVRSRASQLGLPKEFYNRVDIHIHVPEGATPKDGPSAGITIATSLASALTNRPVRKDVAMTGEITLRGHVLPIGGLKEKLLAAQRAGMTTVMIPDENVKDLYDVPKEILSKMKIVPVRHCDQVLKTALALEANDPLTDVLEKLHDDANPDELGRIPSPGGSKAPNPPTH